MLSQYRFQMLYQIQDQVGMGLSWTDTRPGAGRILWVVKISLLSGLQSQGEAYLIPTWLPLDSS